MCARFSNRIEKPIAVAVEGADFLYLLLSQIQDVQEFRNIQLFDFGSVDSLQGWLRVFKSSPEFSRLHTLAIIRDAEDNADQAVSAIQQALRSNLLPVPSACLELASGTPNIGFLVVPHGSANGCIENSLLLACQSQANLPCVEQFLECVDNPARNDNWRAKVKVHALIAASENPTSTLGESARAGLWNFSAPSLQVIVDFFRSLVLFAPTNTQRES
jgi:hypothetical protein